MIERIHLGSGMVPIGIMIHPEMDEEEFSELGVLQRQVAGEAKPKKCILCRRD